jgi:hypothetical protein
MEVKTIMNYDFEFVRDIVGVRWKEDALTLIFHTPSIYIRDTQWRSGPYIFQQCHDGVILFRSLSSISSVFQSSSKTKSEGSTLLIVYTGLCGGLEHVKTSFFRREVSECDWWVCDLRSVVWFRNCSLPLSIVPGWFYYSDGSVHCLL